jgi:hypothetical protein
VRKTQGKWLAAAAFALPRGHCPPLGDRVSMAQARRSPLFGEFATADVARIGGVVLLWARARLAVDETSKVSRLLLRQLAAGMERHVAVEERSKIGGLAAEIALRRTRRRHSPSACRGMAISRKSGSDLRRARWVRSHCLSMFVDALASAAILLCPTAASTSDWPSGLGRLRRV